MVATRGIDDVVAFVLGQKRLDSTTIRTEEWVQIIQAVVDEVPTNYMRGFKSIKQIITRTESLGEPQRRPGNAVPKLPSTMRGNEVFLNCAETGGKFPEGSGYQAWPNAPRETTERGENTGPLATIGRGYFLLSREKKFYYLLVRWLPREEFWDRPPGHPRADDLWYEAEKGTVRLSELSELQLDATLAGNDDRKIPQRILRSIHSSLRESVKDLRGQYDHMFEKQELVGSYLERLG